MQHFSYRDGKDVYGPSEDTYTLIDALAQDLDMIKSKHPLICLEIGTGSGAVTAALSQMLGPDLLYLGVDLNPKAALMTVSTFQHNSVLYGEVVRTDLLSGLNASVDLLVCNPPYVPTSESEFQQAQHSKDITASYAGGPRGRRFTDRVLEATTLCLRPGGLWYLLQVQDNCPGQLGGVEVMRRTTRCETQVVVRGQRSY